MKKWQRGWLYFVILYAFIHLIRDTFQDLAINNFLSMTLTRSNPPLIAHIYWFIFNTYVAEIVVILFGIYSLRRNIFGRLGYMTIIIAFIMVSAWLYYWFFL